MKFKYRLFLFFVYLLWFFKGGFLFAQSYGNLTKIKIDSILDSQILEQNKIDTTFSLVGRTKFYEKKLGFIKVRSGQGISSDDRIFSNKNLHMALYSSTKLKRKRSENYIYRYFFINGSFVKYEAVEYWTIKSDNTDKLRHRIVLYFNDKEVIEKVLDIRDDFKLSKINIPNILEQSIKFDKKLNKTKPNS
ncbi:MAG: hypothetical protein JEZ01_19110 [Labilibaculum sp.]|nr:hypothetical protein [Labilibaculum sp.]MBI9059882.1 hypothetical protein [Labilibaculum sp.]